MDNHVHLLLTPSKPESLASAMRALGQSYVQAFNAKYGRSGTLWQGRFKSCLVDSDRYLLTVCRYIELNPVRATMVSAPEDYRWSSVHTHLGTACDPLITPHPVYLALALTFAERIAAYREWLQAGICNDPSATRACPGQRTISENGGEDTGLLGHLQTTRQT